MFNTQRKQTGVAMVSVLLIVAILMAVASRLLAGHDLVISQHQNTFEHNQALHYALGAETLARRALIEDLRPKEKPESHVGKWEDDSKIDHLGDIWAQGVLPFELDEGGFLEAQVEDMHACWNLNNLSDNFPGKLPQEDNPDGDNEDDPAEGDPGNKGDTRGGRDSEDESKSSIDNSPIDTFRSLLSNLGLDNSVADAWQDWVDMDKTAQSSGAEDSEYLLAEPPHRTPNAAAADVSELSLMPNMDAEQYAKLAPHVCVLPVPSQINVNTVPLPTLVALLGLDDIDPEAMEKLAGATRQYDIAGQLVNLFDHEEDPELVPVIEESLRRTQQFTVKSEYFRLHAKAQVGETSVTLVSLLHRDRKTDQVTVLQRDFGKLFRSKVIVATESDS